MTSLVTLFLLVKLYKCIYNYTFAAILESEKKKTMLKVIISNFNDKHTNYLKRCREK